MIKAMEFVEMIVDSIRVHVPTGQHVVILKDKGQERYLPIWIGINEANAIALKITGIAPERPITHDLLANVMAAMELKVDKIMVTALDNEVFYAQIAANLNDSSLSIDARPSDAIAIAVRTGAKIMVGKDVVERAAVRPDSDESNSHDSSENRERMMQIQEWVNDMDLPDLGSEHQKPANG